MCGSPKETFETLNNNVLLIMVVKAYSIQEKVTRLVRTTEELPKHNQEQILRLIQLFTSLDSYKEQ